MMQNESSESCMTRNKTVELIETGPIIWQQVGYGVAVAFGYGAVIALSKPPVRPVNVCPVRQRWSLGFRLNRVLSRTRFRGLTKQGNKVDCEKEAKQCGSGFHPLPPYS
jgi:hypothetical protein